MRRSFEGLWNAKLEALRSCYELLELLCLSRTRSKSHNHFGSQRTGAPVVAWLGLYGKTVVPPKVNVEAEYSLDCSDELQARVVMNAHADQFIKERNLQSVLLNP
jgi:hypothetical protein